MHPVRQMAERESCFVEPLALRIRDVRTDKRNGWGVCLKCRTRQKNPRPCRLAVSESHHPHTIDEAKQNREGLVERAHVIAQRTKQGEMEATLALEAEHATNCRIIPPRYPPSALLLE